MHAEQVLYFFSYCLSRLVNIGKKPEKVVIRTILVIKLDEIGDMIYAIPVFKLLKERYPNAELTLYCRKMAAGLLSNDSHINQIVFVQPNADFDLIVDLRGNFKTLLHAITNPPKLRLDRGTIRFRNRLRGSQAHELVTNIAVLVPLKIGPTGEDITGYEKYRPKLALGSENIKNADEFLSQNGLKRFCILHTGARDPARRWPFERFADLASRIKKELNLDIIFSGGPEDAHEIERSRHMIPFGTYSFAGKGNLLDFAALCNRASLFVGNESGPLHIANTFDIPLVGLFGPGVKDVFYPLGSHSRVIHHFKEKNHTRQTIEDSTILKISVDDVWEVLRKSEIKE
jgi:ADP-heptose:LPS heptosyltransferase